VCCRNYFGFEISSKRYLITGRKNIGSSYFKSVQGELSYIDP
jgi:hypothetical protein